MKISKWGILGVALLMGVPAAGWAQAAKAKKAAPAVGMEIEEITVTAQKREENIQEVPISVTALSGDALAASGATSVTDLQESVPNLWIAPTGSGASGTNIAMRGTSNNDPNLSKNTTVGLYIDGVAISKIQGNNFDLEDLERVEVLRGPQGTLFGRNTTGGAVNMVTKKPTEEREIIAGTEVGSYDAFHGRLTVNVPLIGKNGFVQSDALGVLSLRENVVYKSHDGYAENSSPTSVKATGGSELNTLNRVFNMTGLRWQPRKDITLDYAFEYHRYRETPSGWHVTKVYEDGPSPVNGGYGSLFSAFDLRPYVRKNRAFGEVGNSAQLDNSVNFDSMHRLADDGNHRMHLLTGAWDLGEVGPLGNVTLKSISGYRSMTFTITVDLDGSPLHVFDTGGQRNLDTWSEEVQWVGTTARVRYVVGAYYYGEHSTSNSGNVIFGGNPFAEVNMHDTAHTKNSSYAPFGQATWTPPILNDKLSVTAGLRYSEDHIHSQLKHNCINVIGLVPGAGYTNVCPYNIVGTRSFDKSVGRTFGREGAGLPGLQPMANIAYQWTDDLMTYFRASRGYQSGTANDSVTDERLVNTTNPERLESYEAGFKSQWWGNRLRFNADGFLSRYKDQVVPFQVFSQQGGLTTQNLNAGKSEYWGSEVEVTAIPLRGLEVTGNYSYLSAKYLEFKSQQIDANGLPVFDQNGTPVLVDVANQRKVEYAPAHTFTVGLTYTAPPSSAGVFSAHVDTYFSDRFFGHPEPPQDDAMWSYAVVNGRLQLVDIPLAKGSLDLSVFGRNLFDRKYRVQGFGLGALGWAVDTYGDPRTFGLGMTYRFASAQEAPPPPAPVAQAAPPPPPPAKKKIVLRSVHFDFDKATLKAEAKPILDEAVQVLKQEGSVDIVVEGHTDSVGTDQYNLGLSRRRAETVRTYLVEHGIARPHSPWYR
ncbi:MAG: TonB-dependent receptor [Deltaproteobacteria bacterium]|nr:TonB-dependent receptor [Deltaproteobacteria bacterium]